MQRSFGTRPCLPYPIFFKNVTGGTEYISSYSKRTKAAMVSILEIISINSRISIFKMPYKANFPPQFVGLVIDCLKAMACLAGRRE